MSVLPHGETDNAVVLYSPPETPKRGGGRIKFGAVLLATIAAGITTGLLLPAASYLRLPTLSSDAPVATAPIPPPLVDTEALVRQGDALVGMGNITEARTFFEHAARAGDPEGAFRIGATYDPEFLNKARLKEKVQGDPAEAKFWYDLANRIRQETGHQ